MALRHHGRHRRPTRELPVRAATRCTLAIAAAGAVSLGMASPALAHTGQHTVRAGDTLGQLATAHGTSWQSVYADNRDAIGGDPNQLRVGQVLTIDGGAAAPAASAAPAAPATTSASGVYVVQAGDTLSRIAARAGTTWQQLYARNAAVIGGDPGVLRIGQRLDLGGAAARPASEQASRGTDRGVAAPVAVTADAPTPSSTAYNSWAPHVRPVVAEVAERFGVPTVLTRPDHSPTQELAADFMVYQDAATGDAVAQYVIDNASRFRVDYVIWEQRIYLPSSGTWQAMEDRGSPTANHLDHVHVSFLPAG